MSKEPTSFSFFHRGFPCLGCIGNLETWCGYVGVGEEHPLYKIHYDDIEIEVHGGLTFSSCDLPYDGVSEVWWLGFDCAHAGDRIPGFSVHPVFNQSASIYRDIDFVKNECRSLVEQLSDWPIGECRIKNYVAVPTGKRLIDVG